MLAPPPPPPNPPSRPGPPPPPPPPPPGLLALLERATGAGAWLLAMPAHQLTWTAHLAALLEMTPEQVPVWATALDVYAPESRACMAAALDRCLADGTAFDEEVQVITGRGQRLWMRSLGEALRDASGTIVQLSGGLQDLTARKRAEQESQSLTMRLATTLASITDAFATLDREGRLTYVNKESERLLCGPSTALLGQPLWNALDGTDPSRVRQEILAIRASGASREFEVFCALP